MTDEQKIVQPAADDAKDRRTHVVVFLAVGASLITTVVLAVLFFGQSSQLGDQAQRIDRLVDTGNDTAKQAGQLADQVRALGATPVVQPPVPAPSGPTIITATPIPGPGPTQAQIDDAVAAYIAAHPPAAGKPATPAMVATAVADFLTANPPTPGRAPTPEEIATAASSYIASHAADFQGTAGKDGIDGKAGKDATDTQVKAAVTAYCDAHGSCAGPKGDSVQGPQGVSFTDLRFVRDSSGTCQAIATFHDPATGKDASATHPAGDAACPIAPLLNRKGTP